MSVKLSAGMPKGEFNGLAGREEHLDQHAADLVPVVMMLEVTEVGRVTSTDEPTVRLRIAEVEVVDAAAARDLIRAGRKERTGHEELDLEGLEDE